MSSTSFPASAASASAGPIASKVRVARETASERADHIGQAMMDAGLYQASHDATWADVYSSWKDMLAAAPESDDHGAPQE